MDERILSRPIRVLWGGWESTTTRLQQAGWQISAEQDFSRMALRLAIFHADHQIYGISSPIDYDFYMRGFAREQALSELFVPIQYMNSKMVIQVMDNLANFKPIDAYPQFTQAERKSIEDFGIFATPLARTQELLVKPDEIGKILELIKTAQLDEQASIRERNRLREKREGMILDAIPRQTFHAQVVSIAA